MENWINNHSYLLDIFGIFISVISVIITIIIAVLAKKISNKQVIRNVREIRNETYKLLDEVFVKKGRNAILEIVNIKKIKKYPNEDTYSKTEIIQSDGGGIEFFSGYRKVYINKKNKLTTKAENNKYWKDAYLFGYIPFSEIAEIEFHGNAYTSSALIYCRFRIHFKPLIKIKYDFKKVKSRLRRIRKISFQLWEHTPFYEYRYYIGNDNYREGIDHYWDKYRFLCPLKDIGKMVMIEDNKNNNSVTA